MWFFALSIYFIAINENNLLMTAINGFSCNISIIVFGSLIGTIIDKYERLKIVHISLFIQNLTVVLTCAIIIIIIIFKDKTDIFDIEAYWNGYFLYFIQSIVILLNVISNMASTIMKISIERDWVIIIANYTFKNQNVDDSKSSLKKTETNAARYLANINAIVRRLGNKHFLLN
jgi:solute carrier family 40 (iron-regulated transporter), member 1